MGLSLRALGARFAAALNILVHLRPPEQAMHPRLVLSIPGGPTTGGHGTLPESLLLVRSPAAHSLTRLRPQEGPSAGYSPCLHKIAVWPRPFPSTSRPCPWKNLRKVHAPFVQGFPIIPLTQFPFLLILLICRYHWNKIQARWSSARHHALSPWFVNRFNTKVQE